MQLDLIPVPMRLPLKFGAETVHSIRIAKVELSQPDDRLGADVKSEVGKIIKQVNKGVDSPVGNMFFQQYMLDEDRPDRDKRLDKLSTEINDGYKEHR